MVLAFRRFQTVPGPPWPGLSPHTGCSGCPSAWHPAMVMPLPSQSSLQLLAFLPADLFIPPHPSTFHCSQTLGEALIQHRAPRQLCQKAETERSTRHWNKPLHDPV